MSSPVSKDQIEEIRSRVPIASIIGRVVKLERTGNALRGCCPFHGERNPSFIVYPDHYHCYGCGAHGDVFGFVMLAQRLSFMDAVQFLASEASVETLVPAPAARTRAREHELAAAGRKQQRALAMWLNARPLIVGTPVDRYLAGRGIALEELGRQPRALRYEPRLWHPYERVELPAMVAAISDGDGNHVATHCTWLEQTAGGGWIKARVRSNARLTFGPWSGGCIRLWRGESGRSLRQALADEPVALTEGIETGLSIAIAVPEIRIIGAVNKSNLGNVPLPPQLRFIIIAADNDEAKMEERWRAATDDDARRRAERQRLTAAHTLQRAIDRHLLAGRHVRIARAPLGKDFNDTLQDAA